jgi:hypothetical protein
MNYLKVYCNLIRKAENRTPPEGYTEKHHTFPKSIFGKNNRIVTLTSREHYIAHALLEKICIKRYGKNDLKTIKMIYAHHMMCVPTKGNERRYCNSYLYQNLKKRFVNTLSETRRGKNNPMYGKVMSQEDKMKISEDRKGKKPSLETRKKMSEAQKGEKHHLYGKIGENSPSYGRTHSLESRRKMSKSRSGEKNCMYGKMGKNNPNSKYWKITFLGGDEIDICGLNSWAKENGYNGGCIHNVYTGKSKKHKDIIKVCILD